MGVGKNSVTLHIVSSYLWKWNMFCNFECVDAVTNGIPDFEIKITVLWEHVPLRVVTHILKETLQLVPSS